MPIRRVIAAKVIQVVAEMTNCDPIDISENDFFDEDCGFDLDTVRGMAPRLSAISQSHPEGVQIDADELALQDTVRDAIDLVFKQARGGEV